MYPLKELRRLLASNDAAAPLMGVVVRAVGTSVTVATEAGQQTATASRPVPVGTRVQITSAGAAIPVANNRRYAV